MGMIGISYNFKILVVIISIIIIGFIIINYTK